MAWNSKNFFLPQEHETSCIGAFNHAESESVKIFSLWLQNRILTSDSGIWIRWIFFQSECFECGIIAFSLTRRVCLNHKRPQNTCKQNFYDPLKFMNYGFWLKNRSRFPKEQLFIVASDSPLNSTYSRHKIFAKKVAHCSWIFENVQEKPFQLVPQQRKLLFWPNIPPTTCDEFVFIRKSNYLATFMYHHFISNNVQKSFPCVFPIFRQSQLSYAKKNSDRRRYFQHF